MKSVLFFLLLSFSAYADQITSKIHSIDLSDTPVEPHLILLENGNVLFLDSTEEEVLKQLKESFENEETLKFQIDKRNKLKSFGIPEKESSFSIKDNVHLTSGYTPTVVNSSSQATAIFRRMRKDYKKGSLCYSKAHVWVWEEYHRTGLKSNKHFLFFTRRYIRNYNYKWWFHVAPSIKVKGIGDRILDRRYTSGHRSPDSWTGIFVKSKRTCPVVKRYDDYRNHQDNEDCYLIPVSMFYWHPDDIRDRDRTGQEKTSFIQSEVDFAYKDGFGR